MSSGTPAQGARAERVASEGTAFHADHARAAAGIDPRRRELRGVPRRDRLLRGRPRHGRRPTDEVYRWSGAAYGLFYRAYSKGCYDEANSPICASVHYGREYVNAFWDGGHLSFGDEDGGLFNGFSVAVGAIAHEFIHGVVQYGLNLSYRQFVDPVEST